MLKLTDDMMKLYEKKVIFIANKYSNNSNREDLISQGKLGLLKAAKKYDETLGIKFSTFSEKYILGEILEYIRNDKSIRVSRDFIRLKKKIDLTIKEYYEIKKRYPSIKEISYILKESVNKIIEVLNINQNVSSLDETINESDNILLKDTIIKKENISQDDLICLKDALNDLSKEERNIINERYYNGKTQSELAKELNTSQVKVYRMEKKILDELNYKMAC